MTTNLLNPGCGTCYSCDPCECTLLQSPWQGCTVIDKDWANIPDDSLPLPDARVTVVGSCPPLPYTFGGGGIVAGPGQDFTGVITHNCGLTPYRDNRYAQVATISGDPLYYIIELSVGLTSTQIQATVSVNVYSGYYLDQVGDIAFQAGRISSFNPAPLGRTHRRRVSFQYLETLIFGRYRTEGNCRPECNVALQGLALPTSGNSIPLSIDTFNSETNTPDENAFDTRGLSFTAEWV